MMRIIGLTILFCSSVASAGPPWWVEMIHPQAGTRGTDVEIEVRGHHLFDPKDVLFYRKGISVLKMEPMGQSADLRTGKIEKNKPGTRLKLTLRLDKNCPLGQHPLRVRVAGGLSEVVSFYVTPFAVDFEKDRIKDDNDSIKTAQPIALNRSVWGLHTRSTPQDHDFYRIDAKRGQRISIEVVGDRLGTWHNGGMNDPALHVYDDAGRLIARCDDHPLYITDPVLSFLAPKDGPLFIDVHQQMDYETVERFYVMHVGTFSRPSVLYPLGGRGGTELETRILGDPTGSRIDKVQLPKRGHVLGNSDAAKAVIAPSIAAHDGGLFEHFSHDGKTPTPPSGNLLRVCNFDNVLEGTAAQKRPAKLPIAFNGIVAKPAEVDRFQFTATKGERWMIKTFAAALGSPVDVRLWIRKVGSKENVNLSGSASGGGGNQRFPGDDATWIGLERIGQSYRHQIQDRLDPVALFTAPESATYELFVTDTRGDGAHDHVYRVEIHPHRPKLFTHSHHYYPLPPSTKDRFHLPAGSFYTHNLQISAGIGASANIPLKVKAVGLPIGVRMHAPTLYRGQKDFPIFFEVAKGTPLQHHLIDLVLESTDPKQPIASTIKHTVQKTQRRGAYSMHFIFFEQVALAVTQPAPFRLEVAQPAFPIARSGELWLEVTLHRDKGFNERIHCELEWLPPGIGKQVPLIFEPNQSELRYKISARADARIGSFPIALTARTMDGVEHSTGAGMIHVCSKPIQLHIDDPYLTIKLERATVERGKRGTIVGKLKHHRKLPGKTTATLKRLPHGVRVVGVPTISSKDSTVTFKIEAGPDALLGQYKEITCQITIEAGDQTIRQASGSGVLRIDAQRGKGSR